MEISTFELEEIIQKIDPLIDTPLRQKDISRMILKIHNCFPEISTKVVGDALEQLYLREKAQDKFLLSQNMMFISQSLEQATHHLIAEHVASQLKSEDRVVDLTAGIGGDSLAFAQNGLLHGVVEHQNIVREMLEFNLRSHPSVRILDSWEDVDWNQLNTVYLDPDRRLKDGSVVSDLTKWSPNLVEILPEVLSKVDKIVIKVSPAIRKSDLDLLPAGWGLEMIALENDLKQGVLWYGFENNWKYKATNIIDGIVYSVSDTEVQQDSSDDILGEGANTFQWVWYPFPVLRRSGLVEGFQDIYDLDSLDHFPKVFSGNFSQDLEVWGRWYEVIFMGKGRLADLKNECKSKGLSQADIILFEKIGISIDVVLRKLRLREGGKDVIMLRRDADRYYWICAKRKHRG